MAGRLEGKVALITGGARGQGEAEGRLFAQEGATVILTDVLDDEGHAAAKSIGPSASYLNHDVRDEARWREVVDGIVARHGRLDVLVNNAGIFPAGNVMETTLADYERVIAINQTGVFLGIQNAARVMVPRRSGSIVNISSIAGMRGSAKYFGYVASKWAVRGMTRSAAAALGPHGVRVNSVHPGIIETKMLETLDQVGPKVRANMPALIPMGRTAEAIEVARLVLFLASDDASYVSGSEYVVDGAMTA